MLKIRNILTFSNTKCVCVPGFSGESCEILLSCKDNCNKNGECKFGKCFCNPGFIGKNCDIKMNCLNNCNNRGKCEYGKCFCDAGYSGYDCGIKETCLNDCSNKGICFRGKCLCEPGFAGKDCSTIAVDNFIACKDNCNRNGKCHLNKCFCYPGFSGQNCEIKNQFACPPFKTNNLGISGGKKWQPCNGKGVCKYGICFCFPGFKGDDCSMKDICKNNCSNNGICVDGKCVCTNYSNNDDCSEGEFINPSNKKTDVFSKLKFKQINFEVKNNNKNDRENLSKSMYDEKIKNGIERDINQKSKIKTINQEDNFVKVNSSNKTSNSLSLVDAKNKIENSKLLIESDYIKRFLFSGIILSMIFFVTIMTFFLNKNLNISKE